MSLIIEGVIIIIVVVVLAFCITWPLRNKEKRERKAFVICCNDSVEFVAIGSKEFVTEIKEEMQNKHYSTCANQFPSREDYELRC